MIVNSIKHFKSYRVFLHPVWIQDVLGRAKHVIRFFLEALEASNFQGGKLGKPRDVPWAEGKGIKS